jgi:nucleoid DNA-binding protein/phage tail protein X
MNTTELISSLAQRLSLSKTEAAQRLESTITEITAELLTNNSVSFNTFGTIEVEKREEKISVSPISGKRILVPPKLILKFKPLDNDRKEAESFLKELVDTIQEALSTGDSVRIKHLGIFKFASDHEGIDPTTGNHILLPENNKITFIPDSNLADAINEPFLLFDTVELEEEETPSIAIKKPSEEIKPDRIQEKVLYYPPKEPLSPYRRIKRWRRSQFATFFYILLSLIPLAALGYFLYFLDSTGPIATNNTHPVYVPEMGILPLNPDSTEFITIEDSLPLVPVVVPPTATTPPATAPAAATPPASDGPAKQYRLQHGDFLTTIARNEYGKKVFWVYLYEENKSIIRNPNIVPEGVLITIPPASKYGIDKNNPTSVRKAIELQEHYILSLQSND